MSNGSGCDICRLLAQIRYHGCWPTNWCQSPYNPDLYSSTRLCYTRYSCRNLYSYNRNILPHTDVLPYILVEQPGNDYCFGVLCQAIGAQTAQLATSMSNGPLCFTVIVNTPSASVLVTLLGRMFCSVFPGKYGLCLTAIHPDRICLEKGNICTVIGEIECQLIGKFPDHSHRILRIVQINMIAGIVFKWNGTVAILLSSI